MTSKIDLPDLTGRSAVVTGANSGIGYETAKALALAGAMVVLACRDVRRGGAAAQRICRAARQAQVEVDALDLSNLESVQAFAENWTGPLDLLINNAGVMAPPRWTATVDGFELQMGTNHLGHFALTGRLLPWLLAADRSRVVTVSSIAHRRAELNLDDLQSVVGYRPHTAYANSKLANLMFASELQRRAGDQLVSTAAHPGLAVTGLITSRQGIGANPIGRLVGPVANRIASQSAAAGAQPTLYAATVAAPGSYTGPRHLFETRGAPAPASVSAAASDPARAAQLWDISTELTGVEFAL